MKVCGFTIVRNAIKYGYPVKESISSVLPLCDKFIVAVGKSEDDTLELVNSICPEKIEILETIWDDSLREGGKVLAIETNKAFDAISAEFDWCIYIQADEVLHQNDHPVIKEAMMKYIRDGNVEGLLFKYLHFWGTYNYIGTSRDWYRHEIRIIRNNKDIRSYKDAQGFRKNGKKLNVKLIDACVYHYGWVKPPEVLKSKVKNFLSLYNSGDQLEQKAHEFENFDYSQVGSVALFNGSHPEYIEDLIHNLNWTVQIDTSKIRLSVKDYLLYLYEKITGKRLFEYRNYRII